ncbi:unnamed protein product [Polarella glacialis]|uniref:ATP-dependent transporter ycf16 n=1 Tax=Polarella glacialis TaxID=89957 RepID=A0A813EDI2_POLGL|nr:unnamed protein product [Polarella glacialis]
MASPQKQPGSPPMASGVQPSPADEAGLLATITFSYGLPLMRVGAQRPLQLRDVPTICVSDSAEVVVQRVQDAWDAELLRRPKRPSLLWALFRASKAKIIMSGVYAFLESAVRIAQPVLLQGFLRALTADKERDMYLFASGLVLVSLAQAVIHHQFFYVTMTTGWNLRTAVTGMLHWKLLKLRSNDVGSASSVDCYNLVSNDCQRFDLALPFLHMGWSAIMDVVVVGALVVLEVGWAAMLGSFAVIVVFVMVMSSFGSLLLKQRRITAALTDERLKLTSETIGAVMSVKTYCWEGAFVDRLSAIRSREHGSIFRTQVMTAATGTMYFTLAPISSFVLFMTFVGRGERLSLPIVYTVLSLLLTLRISVGKGFAQFVRTGPECLAAIGRMQTFLTMPEVQHEATHTASHPVLEVTKASFAWPGGSSRALADVSFKVSQGELLVVSGPVGCGKSALLQALLGELDLQAGRVDIGGLRGARSSAALAYAPQTPWICAGTLRANVLLGSLYDEVWYDKVMSACCLKEDLQQLGALGDLTEIGERGVNLSGGQRARVGLARAVYAKPEILLLDDPLAAVDPAVATRLIQGCIRGPVLSSTAVVLCTHQESVFPLADTLLLLGEGGVVRSCGLPKEVAAACGLNLAASNLDAAPVAAETGPVVDPTNAREDPVSGLVRAEDRKQGSVGLKTYVHFAKLAGYGIVGVTFMAFLFSQVTLLLASYWLGVWAEAEDQSDSTYIVVFSAFTGACVLCACVRSILFYSATLRASSSMHTRALQGLLRTHLGFFTANPQGRIMNRFSGDLGNVDELLSGAMHEVADLGSIIVGSLILVSIAVPPIIPVFCAMIYYMIRLRRFVVSSMTELKRLDSITRSPVFDCFADSMRGLSCIRAFSRQEASQQRMIALLQTNAEAWYWWLITNRFIGFRLDVLCVVIMAFAAIGGAALRDTVSPQLVGLAVVEVINMSGLFQFMVRQSALVESFMTSFERLKSYSHLPPEEDAGSWDPSPDFPSKAELQVTNLSMRYRSDLPVVLKDVNFSCSGGVKIGICGRTGSGKSSFFMALSRLADITGGSIAIDGVDIASMPLKALRRCIAWVPQEPSFFSGTLRMNLDPCGLYEDKYLLAALLSVQMVDAVGPQGLNLQIENQGSNFSVGERQLLSLARALLQQRRLLCMDEAFANVDFVTDSKVQAAIRTMTQDLRATVLVIAHRMQTLADSDHIVVMDAGRVVEHGSPKELLAVGGFYANMVGHTPATEAATVTGHTPALEVSDLTLSV